MVRKLLRYTGKRRLIGLFGPLLLGSILLYLIEPILGLFVDERSDVVRLLLYSSHEPFVVFIPTVFVIAFMVLGVQSIIYSFVMEYLVLRYIKDKYKIMLLSAALCLLFPFWGWISLAKPGDPSYAIDISFYIAGGLAGLILGYLLYYIYRVDMQYAQLLFIKKRLNQEQHYWQKFIEKNKTS